MSGRPKWLEAPQDRLWWWALLGPSLIIFTLLVLGMRAAWPMATLPLVVLVAVPVCSWLGVRGLVVCFALLVLGMVIDLRSLPAHDRIWHMGVGAAISVALLLMVLAREEVQQLCKSALNPSTDPTPFAQALDAAQSQIRTLEEQLATLQEKATEEQQARAAEASASFSKLQEATERMGFLSVALQEKKKELRNSSGTVWQVETRLETLLRDQAERAVGTESSHEGHLLGELANLAAHTEVQEQEIVQLEALVSELLAELKQRCVPGLSGLQLPQV